ncbi:MAG: J domain-containing protein [Rhodospirillales bacterium]|nr:J domain-containing protein [Rhodospirillales bacterium]
MNDPYEILGVSSDASLAEIKKAYRNLARERHPDLDKDNPWAADEFKTISVAYDLLANAKTRSQYDRGEIDGLGAKVVGGFRNSQYKAYKSDRTNAADEAKRGSRRAIKINGADVEYGLTLSFLDAAKGGIKFISTTNGNRLKVSVPAGIADGKSLRLKGQGMPGFGGGQAGDALVEIAVHPDPLFKRVETDILMDLPVTLPEAVLGAKVDVPTIDGSVTVTIPPASNTGTILRLKNRGLPLTGKSGDAPVRGDQYITLKVVLPKDQDQEFIDFVKAWSEKNKYEVNRKRADTT